MNNHPKIIVYATTDRGAGRVFRVGEYDFLEEIEILIGAFDKDVILTFEYATEKEQKLAEKLKVAKEDTGPAVHDADGW